MKVVSTAQMQEMDRLMTSEFGVSGDVLMDRAGFGVAEAVDELARLSGLGDGCIRLVAGKGNNGGDAYVAARYLKALDYEVDVLLAGSVGHIKGDALKHLERMKQAGIKLTQISSPDEWENMLEDALGHDGVVVDGVLGTGVRGPARGTAAGAIRFINAHRARCPIVSIDVPSGLDSDTGQAPGDTVEADLTVTMALPTTGLLQPDALPYVGCLDVIDIGFDAELIERYASDLDFISAADCQQNLVARKRAAHKGTFGHVLIVGGAASYSGAVILAARAALRSGTGLVSVCVPQSIHPIVAAAVPEAMVHAAAASDQGGFAGDAISSWTVDWDVFSAAVIGPGLATAPEIAALLTSVFERVKCPVVLDADGLNVLARTPELRRHLDAELVLTPHPGEMARLMGMTPEDVQSDRRAQADAAALQWKSVVVLKGAGTIVAAPGKKAALNLTGNPGMARGGMGDALAGLIGGLVAQGVPSFEAACLGVYLHGRAGDRVAWTSSQAGMTTSDLIEELACTFAELTPR